MEKTAIEANIRMDSDRSFIVEVIPKKNNEWQIAIKNELANRRTELPMCHSEKEALGGFGQTLTKLSMQAVWGKASTWGIVLNLCSNEKLIYGDVEDAQVIKSDEIRKIREKLNSDEAKDAVDNAIEVAKYFIHEISCGNISC